MTIRHGELFLFSPQTCRLLAQAMADGWKLDIGRHDGNLQGYFARFYTFGAVDGRESSFADARWEDAGHGLTPTEAIEQAWQLVTGDKPAPVIMPSEAFEPANIANYPATATLPPPSPAGHQRQRRHIDL
jgi:hypothetical protein